MKDYLVEILKFKEDISNIFSETERAFILQEKTLATWTLNTYELTKEYLEARYKILKDMKDSMNSTKPVTNNINLLSPGYMEGTFIIRIKYNFYKMLLENLEEGLTYRGVLNKVSTNSKDRYNKLVEMMSDNI